jgi:hypothetical protein
MSIGQLVRQLFGKRVFAILGRLYRRLFVDLDKVAQCLSEQIPPNALILDVGGGDGEPINRLFMLRTDVRVHMIDLTNDLGGMILPHFESRITRFKSTTLEAYISRSGEIPDVLMLLDVIHHIPGKAREGFFRTIGSLIRLNPKLRLIIKDVEPGYFRARMGYLSDTYITGDKNVELIGVGSLIAIVQRTLGNLSTCESRLMKIDAPNFMVTFNSV